MGNNNVEPFGQRHGHGSGPGRYGLVGSKRESKQSWRSAQTKIIEVEAGGRPHLTTSRRWPVAVTSTLN